MCVFLFFSFSPQVDEKEKLKLAEEVGLTKRKIDYWLWAARKAEKKKATAAKGGAAGGGKENVK
eukprot:COSAG06_NODE_38177_length_426_cov_1.100917_1_plen_63_part_10